jgi:hydrogenase/urease accessory protein HupE
LFWLGSSQNSWQKAGECVEATNKNNNFIIFLNKYDFWEISMRYLHIILTTLLFFSSLAEPSSGHEIKPSIIDIKASSKDSLDIFVRTNLDLWLAGIGGDHKNTEDSPRAKIYEELRSYRSEKIEELFDRKKDKWLSEIKIFVNNKEISKNLISLKPIKNINNSTSREFSLFIRPSEAIGGEISSFDIQVSPAIGPYAVRLFPPVGGLVKRTAVFVESGGGVVRVLGARGWKDKAIAYFEVIFNGIKHVIPAGLDHILFIIGICLFVRERKKLVVQVSVFTLAHSVTLGLTAAGFFRVPSIIIEPLIALSITVVAVDAFLNDKYQKIKNIIIFLFGLFHGIGFASVFREIYSDKNDLIGNVLLFNIGIELAQIFIVLLYFLVLEYFRERFQKVKYFECFLVVAIGASGVFWFFARVFN